MLPDEGAEHVKNELVAPRYDLDATEVDQLTQSLLSERVQDVPEHHRYVAVEVAGDGKYANIGRFIEETVFEEAFGNDSDEMKREYSDYESSSTFFLSIDRQTGKATGALRVIKNSENGLKSYDDAVNHFGVLPEKAAEHPGMEDMDKVWDVGTIAVLPEHRSKEGPVAFLLQRAMYVSALAHDVQSLIAIIDERPLLRMQSVGIPFKPLGGSEARPYLGSGKSRAVHGYIPDFEPSIDKLRKSIRGRLLASFVLGKDIFDRLIGTAADDAIVLEEHYKN